MILLLTLTSANCTEMPRVSLPWRSLPGTGKPVPGTSFIVDQLSSATAIAKLPPQHEPRQFPIDRIAVLGHRRSGDFANIATGQGPHLHVENALDVTLLGPLPLSGLSQPVLYISEPSSINSSWLAAWPKLHGQKL